jgi:hypothetical protein
MVDRSCHGSGPRTEEGKARIAPANFKHGRYSKAGRESRKAELEVRKIASGIYEAEMADIRAARILIENQQREELKRPIKSTITDFAVVPHRSE